MSHDFAEIDFRYVTYRMSRLKSKKASNNNETRRLRSIARSSIQANQFLNKRRLQFFPVGHFHAFKVFS